MRKIFCSILYAIASILVIGTLLSLLRNTDSRYLKMLDFPRIQFFIASLIVLVSIALTVKRWYLYDFLAVIGLVGTLVIQGTFLINYTPLVAVVVADAETTQSSDSHFSLLITNVKMSNRQAQPLMELIDKERPDMVLAMEVDSWWDGQLKTLSKEYPYSQYTVNEEAYGMVLLSKLPLTDVTVHYLHNQNVPSFESTITLADGKSICFFSVHPVPPTHFEDLPDNAGQQETALIKVGRKVSERQLPTLVAGDLNDVVWSHTDKLTKTENMLFDVRVGRGFYNSYNSESILMRWPLDHIFVTKEFRLKRLERLSAIGSDHFPIFVELVL